MKYSLNTTFCKEKFLESSFYEVFFTQGKLKYGCGIYNIGFRYRYILILSYLIFLLCQPNLIYFKIIFNTKSVDKQFE